MSLIDNILEILWRLLVALGNVMAVFLSAIGKMAVAFWELLCDIEGLDWFTSRMNVFFEGVEEMWNSSLAQSLRDESMTFLTHMKNLIDGSRKARIWFFMILFLLLFFWFYPPYKWGPWYLYESGKASYYGSGFYFGKTSSGERFIPFTYTAAHRSLPMGATVKVVNKQSGSTVYVQINDRGPSAENRIIDVSKAAAKKLGIAEGGTAQVELYTRKRYGK